MRHQAHAAPRFGIDGRTVLKRLPEPSLDPPLDPSLASSFDPLSFGATSCDRTMTVNSDMGSPFDPPDAAPLAVKGECKPASLAQGNRVKKSCGNKACQEIVVPGGDFAPKA